jgi:hypothetical protein
VVDLKLRLGHFFQVDKTLATVPLNQRLLDLSRQAGSARQTAKLNLLRIREPVGGNFPSVRANDSDSIQWDAMFFHVAGGARWMVVTVLVLQLFGGDLPVLENEGKGEEGEAVDVASGRMNNE